MNDLVANGTN